MCTPAPRVRKGVTAWFELVIEVMEFKDLSCHDLGEYLMAQGIHENVVAVFNDNRICGKIFMELGEDELREMLPIIGDRLRIRKLLKQVKLHAYY